MNVKDGTPTNDSGPTLLERVKRGLFNHPLIILGVLAFGLAGFVMRMDQFHAAFLARAVLLVDPLTPGASVKRNA